MDGHHVHISTSNASCGILELSGYESQCNKVLYQLASYLYHPSKGTPAAAVIWSDVPDSNGHNLFRFIFNSKIADSPLWNVQVVDSVENPKTGNQILVFYWRIPHEEFKKWYIAERVRRAQQI